MPGQVNLSSSKIIQTIQQGQKSQKWLKGLGVTGVALFALSGAAFIAHHLGAPLDFKATLIAGSASGAVGVMTLLGAARAYSEYKDMVENLTPKVFKSTFREASTEEKQKLFNSMSDQQKKDMLKALKSEKQLPTLMFLIDYHLGFIIDNLRLVNPELFKTALSFSAKFEGPTKRVGSGEESREVKTTISGTVFKETVRTAVLQALRTDLEYFGDRRVSLIHDIKLVHNILFLFDLDQSDSRVVDNKLSGSTLELEKLVALYKPPASKKN